MMKRIILCGMILVETACINVAAGDRTSRFEMKSTVTGLKYDIEVVIPPETPRGMKCPVMYCMDWFMLGDYLKSLPKLMNLGQLTEPYILVGISQGSSSDDWAVMRTRDFTPAYPSDEYSKSFMYPKALELSGGAAKFASFVIDELIPRIESNYPADPSRRCFSGYSLGGLLGVHILTGWPQMFQYYLLGSSSLWFNEFYLAADLKNLPADRLHHIRKVYLSVGEDESWEMFKGFAMLRAAFREKGLDDSRLQTEIIGSAGHVGAMPTALYNGIRFIFRNR